MHANLWNDFWSFLAGLAAMHELGGKHTVLMVTLPLGFLVFFLSWKKMGVLRQIEHYASLIDSRLKNMDTVEWKASCGRRSTPLDELLAEEGETVESMQGVTCKRKPERLPPVVEPPIYEQFFRETKNLGDEVSQQRKDLVRMAQTQTKSLELVERITNWAESHTTTALPPDIVDAIVRSIDALISEKVAVRNLSKLSAEDRMRGPQKMEGLSKEAAADIQQRSDQIVEEWKKEGKLGNVAVDGKTAQYELVKLRACLDAEFNEQPTGMDIVPMAIKYLLDLKQSSLALTHPPAEHDARSAMQSLSNYVGLHQKRVMGTSDARFVAPRDAHKAAADELHRMETELVGLVQFLNSNQFLVDLKKPATLDTVMPMVMDVLEYQRRLIAQYVTVQATHPERLLGTGGGQDPLPRGEAGLRAAYNEAVKRCRQQDQHIKDLNEKYSKASDHINNLDHQKVVKGLEAKIAEKEKRGDEAWGMLHGLMELVPGDETVVGVSAGEMVANYIAELQADLKRWPLKVAEEFQRLLNLIPGDIQASYAASAETAPPVAQAVNYIISLQSNLATSHETIKRQHATENKMGDEILRLKSAKDPNVERMREGYARLLEYLRTEEPGVNGEPLSTVIKVLQGYKKHVIVLRNRLNARDDQIARMEARIDTSRVFTGDLLFDSRSDVMSGGHSKSEHKAADAKVDEVMDQPQELPVDELLGDGRLQTPVEASPAGRTTRNQGYAPGVSVDDYDHTEKDGTVIRREVQTVKPGAGWSSSTLAELGPGAIFRFSDAPNRVLEAISAPMGHSHTTSIQARAAKMRDGGRWA